MSILSPLLKVERVADYAEFSRLREEWNRFLTHSRQNCPFLTHQWFDAWWMSFGKGKDLEILLVRDELNNMAGLAPLMSEDGGLSFIANHEVTDFCDFISLKKYQERFYLTLLDWLHERASDFSRMEFINIPASSPTTSEFARLASTRGFICRIEETEVAPAVSLPDTFAKYLHNLERKNRHELRRKIRKLESRGPVHIERVMEPAEINMAIQRFISLHRKSEPAKQEFWQKEGVPEFFQKLLSLFSLEEWTELYLLTIEGMLIGALVDFLYDDTLFLYNVAYDRDFSSLSPGFYLFSHSIKQAIEEGREKADFLRGREKYKYFFGANDNKIITLTLSRKESKL